MADELKVTIQAQYVKGLLKENYAPGAIAITQAVMGLHGTLVSVGTSEEDMPVGDIATNGWLFLLNLDGSNYVTYGPKDTTMTPFGRIKPGEPAAIRIEPGVVVRWVANTAPVKLKMLFFED